MHIISFIFNIAENPLFFHRLLFSEIQLDFVSGKSILISKEDGGDGLSSDESSALSDDDASFDDKEGVFRQKVFIQVKGFGEGDGEKHLLLSRKKYSEILSLIDRVTPLVRMNPYLWRLPMGDETFRTDEIIRYNESVRAADILEILAFPTHVSKAVGLARVRLVEAQRLFLWDMTAKSPFSLLQSEPRPSFRSVVEKRASDMSREIGKALQGYVSESQNLDASFIRRIVGSRLEAVASEEEIKKDLRDLDEERESFVQTGLIQKADQSSDVISEHEIEDAIQDDVARRVLPIYAEAKRRELRVLGDINERIHLFKRILNSRFTHKEIATDPDHGIRALDAETEAPIPLSELSSGEQHELVLLYELLFEVKKGSVILIDEPELSLHVAWQKRFIPDIQEIQRLRGLKIVIATHSPQIINDKGDWVRELGPKEGQ